MNKKRDNYLYKLNKLICIIFCIWFSWPYANYRLGMYFGVMLTFLWLASAANFLFLRKWGKNLILVVIFFITMIPYIITGEFNYTSFNTVSLLGTFYLFFLGMFMFHYYFFYRKDFFFLGRIALTTITFYTVGSIQTYIGLSMYPEASRYLAIGGLNPDIKTSYSSMGIGGFNFVYSTVFLFIISVQTFAKHKIENSNRQKLLLVLPILAMGLMIFKASYAIAILMSLLGCFLVLITRNKKMFYILLIISICTLLIVPNSVLNNIFLDLSSLFPLGSNLNKKFVDVAQAISNNKGNQSQTVHRFELYLSSLNIFSNYPLFGINGPRGNNSIRVGGHSGWLDMMAYFGLFVTIPMFAAIGIYLKKILKINSGFDSYIGILVVQVFFIVYGIINPILYVYQIGLIVFLVVPSIPYLHYCMKRGYASTEKENN